MRVTPHGTGQIPSSKYHCEKAMKKVTWIKIALMTLALGAAIPTVTGCKTSGLAANASQTVKYTCPMHPEVLQNTPGNCPICGMTLVEAINTMSSATH